MSDTRTTQSGKHSALQHVLITKFGTVVYRDQSRGHLRHGSIQEFSSKAALLAVPPYGSTATFIEECGLINRPYVIRRQADSTIQLSQNGGVFSPNQDGSIEIIFNTIDQEVMLLSVEDFDALQHVLSRCWLLRMSGRRRTEFSLMTGFCIEAAGDLFRITDLLRGCKLDTKSIRVVSVHGRFRVYELFRPLIYLACFGATQIFECASLAIMSAVETGKWPGDIAVISNDSSPPLHLPSSVYERIMFYGIDAADTLDYTLARYYIYTLPNVENYQPIIYIDSDVLLNAPVDDFLNEVCLSDDFFACHEHPLFSDGEWYGARLFLHDRDNETDLDRGFSSGIMGFKNIEKVSSLFSDIISYAYAYCSEFGRTTFGTYDQPFTNYILRRSGLDVRDLNPWASWAYHGEPPPTERKGFIHFMGYVGNATPKLARMATYIKSIEVDHPPHEL